MGTLPAPILWARELARPETSRAVAGTVFHMVEEGWAVSYGRDYDHEETRARNRSAGLWAGEFTRPQDWRRQRAQGS